MTPTPLPSPAGGDNILELNLTSELLSFSSSLGSVPNRGMLGGQADLFLNGVPYLQAINDVTTGTSIGIHLEPGLWICVGKTADPAEPQTVARMASIPHGVALLAQGIATPVRAGAPDIQPVDITPVYIGPPFGPNFVPSQTVALPSGPPLPARIPQDLSEFADTITQEMLDNPNSLLQTEPSESWRITENIQISVSTQPAEPLFGGGIDNIAFLLGSALALGNPGSLPVQNAQPIAMEATFWIETVQATIEIPAVAPNQTVTLQPVGAPTSLGAPTIPLPLPTFTGRAASAVRSPHVVTVSYTQIQYSQKVKLNFNGLTWPHVSVATLVPQQPLPIPAAAWAPPPPKHPVSG